jgi:hypothetical protein
LYQTMRNTRHRTETDVREVASLPRSAAGMEGTAQPDERMPKYRNGVATWVSYYALRACPAHRLGAIAEASEDCYERQ